MVHSSNPARFQVAAQVMTSPAQSAFGNGVGDRGVDPAAAHRTVDGRSPAASLTQALSRAPSGTVIQLAPGIYNRASGEQFPLVIPPGVVLLGNESNQGKEIVIEGGGDTDTGLGRQNVTVMMGAQSQLRGITVINRSSQGTGIWIESTDPVVQNCTIRNCDREGLVALGSANPLIRGNLFLQNKTSGLTLLRTSKGEIWGNICQQMPIGLALGDNSAPLVAQNQFLENQTGVAIAGSARPVLRGNRIANNSEAGLVLQGTAQPDLGSTQDPAGNIFVNNRSFDLNNGTGRPIVSVGNQITPQRNRGEISIQASELTQPLPLPEPEAALLPKTPSIGVSPRPSPPVQPPVQPPVSGTGLSDIQGHWAEPFMAALLNKNIVSGFPDGSFRPQNSLTRGEYAALIAKAFDQPFKRPAMAFQDVAANFWAAPAITKASRMGFIAGFPDGSFRANQQLTRVQGIIALVSGLGLTGGNPGLLEVYSDRAQIPSYATNAIATATQHRLIVNYPQLDQLEPLRPISRAEIAIMVYQALVVLRQAPVIASPYIPEPLMPAALSDVRGHWAEPFIRAMVDQNLLQGFSDGSFQPNAAVSRAEYAVMIAKAFEPVARNPAPNFQDLGENFWAKTPITRATQGGFLAGYSNSRFQPDRPILRVQVLISLVNGLQLSGGHPGLVNRLADQDGVPKYARAAIAAALHNRIVVNYPDVDCLSPAREATRAEVAAMIYQGLLHQGRVAPLPSAQVIIPR